jgi:hypothetical protein
MQIWSTNSRWWQIFQLEGEFFMDPNDMRVLEVKDAKDEEGQAVSVGKRNGGPKEKTKYKKFLASCSTAGGASPEPTKKPEIKDL